MCRRLRILTSNYGRDQGWYVEVQGRRLAALSDCRYADMFWDSYRVEPLTHDLDELRSLYSEEFWDRCDGLVFRSREFGLVAPNAFPRLNAGAVLKQSGRLVMRGLYLDVPCHAWDPVLLWLWKTLNGRPLPRDRRST